MSTDNEDRRRLGRYAITRWGEEQVRAFVPPALPPDPPLRLEPLQRILEQANQALGRLDGLASALPDLSLFIYAYVRKEAVLSSQIEGTQSSLSDLLPLSRRLIREIHGVLLSKGRGSEKQPGEFRTSQNWIGGTRPGNAAFVPPPPEMVMECMGALELFLHAERSDLPLLIRAGLVHVQFETIHPFLDGNGRLGRLLITFLLCAGGALREPILYLSLFFKAHRQAYYELLDRVRTTGDWEAWLDFFLMGVKDTAEQAIAAARRILDVLDRDRQNIESLGRAAPSVLRVFHHAQMNPILSIADASAKTGISFPTVASAVAHMQRLGVLREITRKRRKRLFVYDAYLAILNEGTELPFR